MVMGRVEALADALRGRDGTPRELAEAVGADPGESSFRRALRLLVDAGELVAIGQTKDRRYGAPEVLRDAVIDRRLLEAVPCSARQFSDVGHAVGLHGSDLGARKLALGLETRRDADGAWVVAPASESDGRPDGERSVTQRPTSEAFAHMAAVANAHATKGVIAGRSKDVDR